MLKYNRQLATLAKPLWQRSGRRGRNLEQSRLGRLAFTLIATLSASSGLAQAAVVDISAAFKPSSGAADYTNTTPPSGFCLEYGGCGNTVYSVAVPLEYERTVLTGLPVVSRRWSLHMPPQRSLTLQSAEGHTITAKFQITHIAQVLSGNGFDRRENPAAHSSTGGNCTFIAPYGNDGGNKQGFVWKLADPVSPGLCYPTTAGTSTEREINVTARSLSVGYDLVLPPTQTVKSGRYQGSITYSVGEVGDFSLGGHVANLSDSSVTFNFTVDVQHQLSVTFPPGSDAVELMPPPNYGGWHQYLSGLKPAPVAILKDLPIRVSATGPFMVSVRCDEASMGVGSNCWARHVGNHLPARFVVVLTLPPGIVTAEGAPFSNVIMLHERVFSVFAKHPVVDGAGLLRIVTEANDFRNVLLKNPGRPFIGSFTLVFDAQL